MADSATRRIIQAAKRFETGLADMVVNIYNPGGTIVVTNGAMTEQGSTGVYYYDYTATALGSYLVIVSSASTNLKADKTFTVENFGVVAASVVTTTVAGSFYTDTLKAVRVAGVGVEIKNENVGTGDSSATSYDLDNGNVVAGSYTLKYAASGSNSFTDLTETTHYVIDKDGGTVELTSSGVTALSTNVLLADYTHSPKMSDTIIASYLNAVNEEVDRKTGRYWGTPTTRTDYFDGRPDKYPHTDRPFVERDNDASPRFQLTRGPVTELNQVAFLVKGEGWGNVQSFDASGSAYTDNTGDANSVGGTEFDIFASTPATSDIIYFGLKFKFHGMVSIMSQLGTGTPTIAWTYWDGSAWSAFTPTEQTADSADFLATGRFTWSTLSGWQKTTVNSSDSLYFVRAQLTGGSYTIAPTSDHIAPDQDDIIQTEIALGTVDFRASGEVTLLKNSVPFGDRNVKVAYKYGELTTNPLIAELAALLVGVRMYANITGGSYDDETGYTLGRMQVSIGEVYVNVREVVRQFQVRIEEILHEMGRRVHLRVV